MKSFFITCALVVALIPTQAQYGTLDFSFGTDGRVLTPVLTGHDYGYAVAVQPDGKILLAGMVMASSNYDFALIRYNTDGSLDGSFDSDGIVITDFGGPGDAARDILVQPDGKIIEAGTFLATSDNGIALRRFNPDGSNDNTFGTAGYATADEAGVAEALNDIAIQPDGKIVVTGSTVVSGNNNFSTWRFNADGSIDNTFGVAGQVITNPGVNGIATAVLIQPDDKILVCGSGSWQMAQTDFVLARYNTDGTADFTLGSGFVFTDFGSPLDNAWDMAFQPDGKLLIAGNSSTVTGSNFAVARYFTATIGTNDIETRPMHINVYPNPVSDQVNVVFETPVELASLRLMNVAGQIIGTKANVTGNSFSIDVSQLPTGIYMLEVANEGNIARQKIMVAR